MGVMFATLVFLLLAFVWAALPFWPGLREIRRQRDTGALPVQRNSQVDVRHFARGFQGVLEAQYGEMIAQCRTVGKPLSGDLPGDGGAFLIVPHGEAGLELADEEREFCERVVISAGDLILPDDFVHAAEVQAAGNVRGGVGSVYRAILADGSLQLAEGSASLRWLHAGTDLSAEPGCLLHGRVSADGAVRLSAGCRFERLHAPQLDFGTADEAAYEVDLPLDDPKATAIEAESVPHLRDSRGGRWLVGKDFELKAGQLLETDMVAHGDVVLRQGSIVRGSLKSRGRMTLESGVLVTGSLTSEKDMVLGENCFVGGPVICEETLTLQRGCVVGGIEEPTTISTRRVLVEPGARCHGTIWAHDHGDVLAPQGVQTT